MTKRKFSVTKTDPSTLHFQNAVFNSLASSSNKWEVKFKIIWSLKGITDKVCLRKVRKVIETFPASYKMNKMP